MVSSNDVTITEHEGGEGGLRVEWEQGTVHIPRILYVPQHVVAALRAHFVAEIDDPNHAYVIGYRKALDDVAERMPEDVQELVDEARENVESAARGVPDSQAARLRAGIADDPRLALIVRLTRALEAVSLANATNAREADEALRALEAAQRPPVNLPTIPGVYAGQRKTRWELDADGAWWFRGYEGGAHPTPDQQGRTPSDVLDYGMPLILLAQRHPALDAHALATDAMTGLAPGAPVDPEIVRELLIGAIEHAVSQRPPVSPAVQEDANAEAAWALAGAGVPAKERWRLARVVVDALLARFSVPSQPEVRDLAVRANPEPPSDDHLEETCRLGGLRAVWRNGCDAGMVAP